MSSAAYSQVLRAPERRLLEGAGWSMAGAACAQLCLVAASIAVARLLGPSRFGGFAFVQATVNTAANVSAAGLGLTAMRYLPLWRESEPARAGSVIQLSRLVALIAAISCGAGMWLCSGWLAGHAGGGASLAGSTRIGAVLLVATVLQISSAGALLGLEEFSGAARLNALRGLAMAGCSVGGAVIAGETGAVAGLTLAAVAAWMFTERVLRRAAVRLEIPLRGAGLRPALSCLRDFSLPALLNSVIAMPAQWAAQTMMLFQPGGLEQNAILQAAVNYRSAAVFLPAQAGQAAVPVLAVQKGHLEHGRALAASAVVILMAALPAAAVMVVFREPLMSFYGPNYQGHANLLMWSAATGALIALAMPAQQALAAGGRMWTQLAITAAGSGVLLGATWLGLRNSGGAGAVIRAYAFAFAVQFTLSAWALRRFLAARKQMTEDAL